MSYRLSIIERDLSGFVTQSSDATGAMVVESRKGYDPVFVQSEKDVLLHFGKPNSTYWGVFEAIEYARVAPLWLVPAVGTGAKWAGVDVKTDSVASFGLLAGRNWTTFSADPATALATAEIPANYTIAASADGKTALFSGTITPPGVLPLTQSSVKIKVGSRYLNATVATNQITGTDISGGPGTFDGTTGAYSFTIAGTVGTVATYTTTIDVSVPIDLSAGAVDKFINITIDGTLYANINLGQSATTSSASIISAINTAVGATVASVSGNFIKIDGLIASANLGSVIIANPTTGTSALNLVFDAVAVSPITGTAATSPTGAVPQAGQAVVAYFTYADDISATVSHSLFTVSPFDDSFETYAVKVEYVTGSQYKATLYQKLGTSYSLIKTYNYSLIKEKDAFGKSLYYGDVFDEDPYLKIAVNTSYIGVANPTVAIVDLTGGERGAAPLTADKTAAWNTFQAKNKYRAKLFMDVYGDSASTVQTLVETYQAPHAFGITVVPSGNSPSQAKTFRQGLSIDTDKMAIYTNWIKIQDVYNNSFAWVSGAGKIGVKYAQTSIIYDGLAPAGVDENGIGGQLSGFSMNDVEYDYTDAELQLLNEAQINPLIFDEQYGVMIYGNRTMQVTNSDTSFIHTRRLYNKILTDISQQVLRKQEFKLNDELHRLLAKSQTDSYLVDILAKSLLRDAVVVCDESNNTDAVLNAREFILDIYVKATPDSEFVLLKLTRLDQGAVIADFLP